MNQAAENGGNASFICAINGTTEEIAWYNEDGKLEPADGISITNGSDFNSTLSLTNITNDNYQIYSCRGSDGNTTVTASAVLGKWMDIYDKEG